MGLNPSCQTSTITTSSTLSISLLKDMDIDLSPFPTQNITIGDFKLIKEHMTKYSSEGCVGRISSTYRSYDSSMPITYRTFDVAGRVSHTIQQIQSFIGYLFFPVWILLALIPEEKERNLTIENIVVAQVKKSYIKEDPEIPGDIIDQLRSFVGKGSLIIKKLTVVCLGSKLCNVAKLMKELNGLGNIKFEQCKLKVILDTHYNIGMLMEELDIISSAEGVYVKLMLGDDVTISYEPDKEKISSNLENDYLEAEIPTCKWNYNSPHTMFGTCYETYGTSIIFYKCLLNMVANRILIGTLGYGCIPHLPKSGFNYTGEEMHLKIIDGKNFTNDTAPVYNPWYTSPWIIHDYTNSSFIICQTTYYNGVIVNGATSKAIKWLSEKWKETWKDEYDNLVVLIPYGGQYMEDEMIQIHEATNEGIIIVCAAGEMGGDVVFPAALGTVLSVGVSNSGPKGREVDIHVSEESLTQNVAVHKLSILQNDLPVDCGVAAAVYCLSSSHVLTLYSIQTSLIPVIKRWPVLLRILLIIYTLVLFVSY